MTSNLISRKTSHKMFVYTFSNPVCFGWTSDIYMLKYFFFPPRHFLMLSMYNKKNATIFFKVMFFL